MLLKIEKDHLFIQILEDQVMKTRVFTFAIGLIAVALSATAFADWKSWTVWQKAHNQQHSIEGKVKTIAVDESTDRLIVKVEKANGSIEVVHICHEGVQSARHQNQVFGSPKQSLLKSAMSRGQKVQLSYGSNFDRCIESVSILSKDNPSGIQEASHKPIGDVEI